jgi:phosphoglycolate phosphatase
MVAYPFSSLLFDLDGTLVDTAPDLINALNHVFMEKKLSPVPSELVRPYVGLGALAMLQQGFQHHGIEVDTEQLTEAHGIFRTYYEQNICVESRAYDGVWDVIPAFYEEGYRLSVCTNKPEYLAVSLLQQLDLAKYFAAICGSDTVPNRKPHRDHLAITVERAGTSLDSSVMVGDASPDVDGARNAAIPIIGFDYGYSPVAMADLSPDILLSSFGDLPAALEQLSSTGSIKT